MKPRIYLSPPHLSGEEQSLVAEAFASNWVAPLGPHVDAFEREFSEVVGGKPAVALSSGTAAIHLALQLAGVERGSTVMVSSFTFAASVNPIIYCGAVPHFIDSELESWNMDPELLAEALQDHARKGNLPKAIVVVHLYGQTADMDAIRAVVAPYDIPIVEDAAEALGATYKGAPAGSIGSFGAYSFNGNKIITTSGGGMLACESEADALHARKLATQAREPVAHYEHTEIGFNYRMSNVLAGIGRAQLRVLGDRVAARRRNFEFYLSHLRELPGLTFMPEAPWGTHNRWLTCVSINPKIFGADREKVRLSLEQHDIESRPLWKPMHMQPVFNRFGVTGGLVSETLFDAGLCLPSGSSLSESDLLRVVEIVRQCHQSTEYSGTGRDVSAGPIRQRGGPVSAPEYK